MRVYLGLGSNVGDRERHLATALDALRGLAGVRLCRVSPCYETEPLGEVGQAAFLNLAAEIETEMAPLELLRAVKGIERRLGRRETRRWGPREVDIDLILCGDAVVETDVLTVPHKAFRKRAFVLAPLADIAPDAVDPVTGRTVAELARSPDAEGRVEKRGVIALTP
ncbi:MAG TPA: 2-amino-4-hydroxy-6-hydroxymethyldihydropteridine diphosphokinase [Candidatus Hydrogenedentes bacterium]|nr:2-amino-4-hydroxy-6-hydroxymethyldihydropteridine diphosphokinase [Candidatus Hydrogenedentota bacterium]HNT87901.1 2-amino-4-hydroxy-6-hydroxymethyldihydropteridine diphosphokinase [Candidatus Hydrogenedentota bacterium]